MQNFYINSKMKLVHPKRCHVMYDFQFVKCGNNCIGTLIIFFVTYSNCVIRVNFLWNKIVVNLKKNKNKQKNTQKRKTEKKRKQKRKRNRYSRTSPKNQTGQTVSMRQPLTFFMILWKPGNDAIIRNYDVTVSISIIDRYRLSNIDQYPIPVSIDLRPALLSSHQRLLTRRCHQVQRKCR